MEVSIKEKIESFGEKDRLCKFPRFGTNVGRYTNFFSKRNLKGYILDFGCGPGYSIYVGRKFGLRIVGLDIDISKDRKDYYELIKNINNVLDVRNDIVIYDGYGRLPFGDGLFDYIIAKASIAEDFTIPLTSGHLLEERLLDRVKELIRISKNGASWYIRPRGHRNKIREIFKTVSSENSKSIELEVWLPKR